MRAAEFSIEDGYAAVDAHAVPFHVAVAPRTDAPAPTATHTVLDGRATLPSRVRPAIVAYVHVAVTLFSTAEAPDDPLIPTATQRVVDRQREDPS